MTVRYRHLSGTSKYHGVHSAVLYYVGRDRDKHCYRTKLGWGIVLMGAALTRDHDCTSCCCRVNESVFYRTEVAFRTKG